MDFVIFSRQHFYTLVYDRKSQNSSLLCRIL